MLGLATMREGIQLIGTSIAIFIGLRGSAGMLLSFLSKRRSLKKKQWPVKILVETESISPNWRPSYQISSIECSVKFELAKGVTEIILMDLKIIKVDTGFPQEPSSSFNVSFQPSQWHDGMRLTTNNVLIPTRCNHAAIGLRS
jgi:hypothetical protein